MRVSSARINKAMGWGGAENMASASEPEKIGGGPKGSPKLQKNRHYCCR